MSRKDTIPLRPAIRYDQDLIVVMIAVKLKLIQYPVVKIEQNNVYLKCVAEKEKQVYELSLQLYDTIDNAHSGYEIDHDGCFLILKKKYEVLWPFLTKDENRETIFPDYEKFERIIQTKITKDFFSQFPIKERGQRKANIVELEEDLQENAKEKISCPEVKKNYSVTTVKPPLLKLSSYSRHLVHVNDPAVYKIIAEDKTVTSKNIKVSVETPSGETVSADLFPSNTSDSYSIKYVPKQVGTHKIKVFANKQLELILLAEAYDLTKIFYDKPKQDSYNHNHYFEVDCSKAGEGELEVYGETEDFKEHNINIEKISSGKYKCSFLYFADYDDNLVFTLIFNGKVVKDDDNKNYSFKYSNPNHFVPLISFPASRIVPIGKLFTFKVIDTVLLQCNIIDIALFPYFISPLPLKMSVVGPSGSVFDSTSRISIYRVSLDEYCAQFIPDKPGVYKIHVTEEDTACIGSPTELIAFNSNGFDMENIILTIPYKPNQTALSHLTKIPINQTAMFFIDYNQHSKELYEISIIITVTNPEEQEVPVVLHGYGYDVLVVEFTPTILGKHKINIVYNGQSVQGSPFISNVVTEKKWKRSK